MKNIKKAFVSLLVCGVAFTSAQSVKAYTWSGNTTVGSLTGQKRSISGVKLDINYGEVDADGNLVTTVNIPMNSNENSTGSIIAGCTGMHYSMSLNNADANSIVKSLNTSNGTTNQRERLDVNVLKTGTQTVNILTTNTGDDWPTNPTVNQYDNVVVVKSTYSTNFIAAANALGITLNEENTLYYTDNINVNPTNIDYFEGIIDAKDEYEALNAYEKQLIDSIIASKSSYTDYNSLYTAADNYLTSLANLFINGANVNGLKGEVIPTKENAQTIIDAETEYNGLKEIVKERVNELLVDEYESVEYSRLLTYAKALKFVDTYKLDTKLASLTKNIDITILNSEEEWDELSEEVQEAVEFFIYSDEEIPSKYSYEIWMETVQNNYDQRIAEEFVNKYSLENYDLSIFEDYEDTSYVDEANRILGSLTDEYSGYSEGIQEKIDSLVGNDWELVTDVAQNYLDELAANEFVKENKLNEEYTEEIATNIVNLKDEFEKLSDSVKEKVLDKIDMNNFDEKIAEAQDYLDELAANRFIATNELLEEMTTEIASNTLLLDDDFKALSEGAQEKVLDLLAAGNFKEVKDAAQLFLDTENAKSFISENVPEELSKATEANFNKILATEDNYDKLSDSVKEIVNAMMEDKYDTDYEKLVADAEEIKKNTSYKMLDFEEKYDISDAKEAVFRSSGTFALFKALYMDDQLVDPSNYTTKEGSTIVTLKPEYMATLSTGEHTLKMVYVNDLSAQANFTVVKTVKANPKTSDNIILYSVVLVVGFAGLAGAGLYISKKRRA